MRFHLPALPGRPVTHANSTCAYTGKVRRFALMMAARGHEVTVYTDDRTDLAGVDGVRVIDCWPASAPLAFDADWSFANTLAGEAIEDEAEEGDVLGIIGGRTQQGVVESVRPLHVVEYGIGYSGTFAPNRVFESYAWYHAVSTMNRDPMHESADPPYWNDAVIPNYFDVSDFEVGPGGDYLLYLGRLDRRKGCLVAAQIAEAARLPLILAGDGPDRPDYGECIGVVGPDERAELLGGALALLQPTVYIEPFGGSVVEAHLCGTPALTPDVGAFTETVQHRINGYRCRCLGDYLDGIEWVRELDSDMREVISARAVNAYGMETIAPRYEAYFEHVIGGRGFEDLGPTRAEGQPARG